MIDLLTLTSNNTWYSVSSNSFPIVYPCSDIRNDSSALILLLFWMCLPFLSMWCLCLNFCQTLYCLIFLMVYLPTSLDILLLIFMVCLQNLILTHLSPLLLCMNSFTFLFIYSINTQTVKVPRVPVILYVVNYIT